MNSQNTKRFLNDAIIKEISDAVEPLRNGEVLIKVKNQKIVEIDVSEQIRFDDVWKIEGGGGI